MLANGLAQVFTETISRIGVYEWHVGGVDGETVSSILCVGSSNYNSGGLSAKPVVEDGPQRAVGKRSDRSNGLTARASGHTESSWALVVCVSRPIHVRESDVRVNKAGFEFIQKRGRNGVGQMSDQADSGTDESILYGGKAVLDIIPRPLRNWYGCAPVVIDSMERKT